MDGRGLRRNFPPPSYTRTRARAREEERKMSVDGTIYAVVENTQSSVKQNL